MSLFKSDDNWILTEKKFSAQSNPAIEGAFTQGSGYLHIRGSLEEHLIDALQNEDYLRMPANVTSEKFRTSKAKLGTYVPGVFCKHPTLNNQLVNLPYFAGIEITVDGEKLDLEKSVLQKNERSLNLRNGLLKRVITWNTKSGAEVNILFERFVSLTQKHCLFQRVEISGNRDTEIELKAGIDADVRTNGYDHFREIHFENTEENIIQNKLTLDSGVDVTIVSQLLGGDLEWNPIFEKRRARLVSKFQLDNGSKKVIEKRSCICTGIDLEKIDPLNELISFRHVSFGKLFDEHCKVWDERWQKSDIEIDGDAESQIAMRFSIYHLLRSHADGDPRVAIDAKGYAGDAYWGRFFWDTEMYLLPFYSLTAPDKAKTLTDYRIQSLNGAKSNAERYLTEGAKYAWEADPDGIECCPNWHYADHEIHITADVMYGLIYISKVLNDKNYLAKDGFEVILETSKYWIHRIDWSKGLENPQLLGVMGPDEYKPFTNNNFYTNMIVRYILQISFEVLKDRVDDKELMEKLGYAKDYLPLRKIENEIYMQCDDFEIFGDAQFDDYWSDKTRTFASQVSQERLYRTKCLKQADVLMGMFLFPDQFENSEIEIAYDYYLPITTHDSSLSSGIHSIIASRLNRSDDAWNFWKQSASIDLNGGSAEGIHIANAGAAWMVFILGFAGLQSPIVSEILCLKPKIPSKITKLCFPLIWKSQKVFIEITEEQVVVTNKDSAEIEVQVNSERRKIKAGSIEVFKIN